MRRLTRTYPIGCTSAYCGRIDCQGCRDKPHLDEFKRWVDRHEARVSDPIWAPLLYVSKREY